VLFKNPVELTGNRQPYWYLCNCSKYHTLTSESVVSGQKSLSWTTGADELQLRELD
jgi:hypothetical protein